MCTKAIPKRGLSCSMTSIAAAVTLAVTVSGCASTAMKNTSPGPRLSQHLADAPIPATVTVSSPRQDDRASTAVRRALVKRGLFARVAAADKDADYQIAVSSVVVDDAHDGLEVLKSFVVGLTLYTTAGLFADEHDHSVTLTATVSRNGKQLIRVSGTGSYHSEVPRYSHFDTKNAAASKVRRKSWEHAVATLVDQLSAKRDVFETRMSAR
jgi:hypothetical protein